MRRSYENILEKHFKELEQASFICGPRQVGKTTLSKNLLSKHEINEYLSWDIIEDRIRILEGPKKIVESLRLERFSETSPILIFDEIHKYRAWKSYLKGFMDAYKGQLNLLVTGSAKLNIFRKGEDSLMGRYFLYRLHPLSVRELIEADLSPSLIQDPMALSEDAFKSLFQFGGFPEPFLNNSLTFYNKWQVRRRELMIYEDIRTFAQIHEISLLETLAFLLREQAGGQINYSSLAKKVRVSDPTIRRWINVLETFYYCFTLKPWSSNIARSLLKEPKLYLYDWSLIEDVGAKFENFIASHLLKAVNFWTDTGQGDFDLFYLRTLDQYEVDFLVTKDRKPWLMVECKKSAKEPYSSTLDYFQKSLNAPYTVQVALDMPYGDINCFQIGKRHIVPARTFLSQLV